MKSKQAFIYPGSVKEWGFCFLGGSITGGGKEVKD
jgi:hypothetical protein